MPKLPTGLSVTVAGVNQDKSVEVRKGVDPRPVEILLHADGDRTPYKIYLHRGAARVLAEALKNAAGRKD